MSLASDVRMGKEQSRERLFFSLLRYCTILAHRQSQLHRHILAHEEYDDLFQIAMLTILASMDRAIAKYPDDPFPYLIRAVQHAIIKYCCYHSHVIRVPEPHKKDGSDQYIPHSITPLEDVLEMPIILHHTKQGFSALHTAIALLPDHYKHIIEMHYGLSGYAPMSWKEISETLEKRESTLCEYQSKAFAMLRSLMWKSAPGEVWETTIDTRRCEVCDEPLPMWRGRGGRRQRYCSKRCKDRAYYQHRRKPNVNEEMDRQKG